MLKKARNFITAMFVTAALLLGSVVAASVAAPATANAATCYYVLKDPCGGAKKKLCYYENDLRTGKRVYRCIYY
ncbi:hypothetical protein HY312_04520 [Candidatus Saccharibacteria bacterium]|nr:hypothetical protein [Candidatus Saccharibacteria bacterium]